MSLLNLVHKNVTIKFADCAKNQFNPEASYTFRLIGVDAMGFLRIQDLKAGQEAEAYWINKDLVREIHEATLETAPVHENGESAKPQAQPQVDQVRREVTPKPARTRSPRLAKTL